MADYPDDMQDWDTLVADWSRADVIAELANGSYPNSSFFLGVLYLMAGDCVRTPAGQANIPHLRALLAGLESATWPPLRTFRERAASLLADPSTFDYDMWCNAGYLRARQAPAGDAPPPPPPPRASVVRRITGHALIVAWALVLAASVFRSANLSDDSPRQTVGATLLIALLFAAMMLTIAHWLIVVPIVRLRGRVTGSG